MPRDRHDTTAGVVPLESRGAGGVATVYLAHDLKHEREVAIKVLREDLSAARSPP